MTRAPLALLLFPMVLVAAGCAGDYEISADYAASGESPAASAEEPTGESPSPPSAEVTPPPPSAAEAPSLPASRDTRPETAARPVMPQRPEGPSGPAEPAPKPYQPTPPPPASPTPSKPAQPSIRLSAGVALPQSLPTGTAMGFSVDYEFTQGRPSPSSPYAWVVEPSKGQPVKQPVQLRDRGNLQGFILQFRPEHGPFKTHIEDANGNQLSRSLPLR